MVGIRYIVLVTFLVGMYTSCASTKRFDMSLSDVIDTTLVTLNVWSKSDLRKDSSVKTEHGIYMLSLVTKDTFINDELSYFFDSQPKDTSSAVQVAYIILDKYYRAFYKTFYVEDVINDKLDYPKNWHVTPALERLSPSSDAMNGFYARNDKLVCFAFEKLGSKNWIEILGLIEDDIITLKYLLKHQSKNSHLLQKDSIILMGVPIKMTINTTVYPIEKILSVASISFKKIGTDASITVNRSQ